jgi:hypothetical protein
MYEHDIDKNAIPFSVNKAIEMLDCFLEMKNLRHDNGE